MAVEMDSRARLAPGVREFYKIIAEKGLKEALQQRDEPFGDYRTDRTQRAHRDEEEG